MTAAPLPHIGWREWIHLPDMSDVAIKAKIDTGARTSALHAHDLQIGESGHGGPVASFELRPHQHSHAAAVRVSWPVHEFRDVRSSNGGSENRPVVVATLRLGTVDWPVEITLTSRDEMGFRMLLGRAALKSRFLIDPGRSYLQGDGPAKSDSDAEEATRSDI